MQSVGALDLNLLVALDALLAEGSVSGAARRLHLTESALSRALGRIRRAMGDPILVRAGHRMVPTPRALAVQTEVHDLVDRAHAVFTPAREAVLATLSRTFTILSSDVVTTAIGVDLLARLALEAPGVRVRFGPEPSGPDEPLRDGTADLELGEIDSSAPEIHTEVLGEERAMLVVRAGHPLTQVPLTPTRLAAGRHVVVSRRGRFAGPVDDALAGHGLRRMVAVSVPSQSAALLLISGSDLIGLVPTRLGRDLLARLGLVALDLDLGVELPTLTISQAWHPRHDADAAHRWLRGHLRDTVRRALMPATTEAE